jgi:hypothetical protein
MTTLEARVFSAMNLLCGALLALAASSPWAGGAVRLFLIAQPDLDPALADTPFARWILGLAGGIWAGWGTLMLLLGLGWDPRRASLAALGVWCALDSLASAANGAWLNLGVNLSWLLIGAWAWRARG